MIRILHVISSLELGGSQAMVMNLYRNIDREKIQFDFVIDKKENTPLVTEIKSMGGKIYIIPTLKSIQISKYCRMWDLFFKKHPEYKIIHAHKRSTASLFLYAANKNGLITIAHSHSNSSGTGIASIIKRILQFPIRYIADYFFACSKPAGYWLFGKKVCEGRYFKVINNAINAKQFTFDINKRNDLRKKMGLENQFVAGHVGRFIKAKNHDFILDVFKNIQQLHPNSKLLLVGGGELMEDIKNKVLSRNIKNSVIFLGERSDIYDILQVMDVFLFPSLYEGLGIALIEAQASGLPCIVSEHIPTEAFITNLVEVVSLNVGIDKWAEKALKCKDKLFRKDTQIEIVNYGFDINTNCSWIQKFYTQTYINNYK